MGSDRTGGRHAVPVAGHPHEAAVPHGQADTGSHLCHHFRGKAQPKGAGSPQNGIWYELRGEQYYPCLLPPEPDHTEEELLEAIIRQMAKAQGIDEDLKECDPLAWVGAMNNIKSAALLFFKGET